MEQRRLGAVVTLVLVLVVAIVLTNALVGKEQTKRRTMDEEWGDGAGSFLSELEVTFYDQDGNPLRSESAMSLVTAGGKSFSSFDVKVLWIQIEGKNIDPNTLKVTLYLKYDKSSSDSSELSKTVLEKRHFEVTGDTQSWVAVKGTKESSKPSYAAAYRRYPESDGDNLGLNYEQNNFFWMYRVKVKVEAGGLDPEEYNEKLTINTDWDEPESSLNVNAEVESPQWEPHWVWKSFIPGGMMGYSTFAFITVILVWLWYEKLRVIRW